MSWLAIVIRVAIAPVLLGAVATLMHSQGRWDDLAVATGLLLLCAVHAVYWWAPWRRGQRQSVVAIASMVVLNFILLNLFSLSQPLVWLYPALIAGAGLRTREAVVAIGLTALAAAAPLALEGQLVHPVDPLHGAEALGPSHSVLLSIVLAGLGMNSVRQLIAANADLHATRAELADLAVAADRERLMRELHDLLARTLSLIAVKAELASRLSATGDAEAAAELSAVQHLARQAVRDVRDAVAGSHSPNLDAELAAAEGALRAAGVRLEIERKDVQVDPERESTLAWAVREAVTNVVKHSSARTCRITLEADGGGILLEVDDDGQGALTPGEGTGLEGLADRVRAAGGALEVGPTQPRGFRLRVRLSATAEPLGISG